ncbi:surface-adhesin E family protein [Pseudoduganella violaceinigra]|uniref:surface-adhesin E family protein n=1 Tax=Pseudoduganella violaceinigra TaxID=246602 RepID=UPI0004150E66|nr:surface-adhesin E family protein [Pseudoduganella violaceinigra]
MKPAVLLLALAPSVALAGPWTTVASDKDSTLLLDRKSVRSNADGLRAWTMESYRKPQTAPDGKMFLSVRSLHLYGCAAGTRTLLSQTYHAEVLGKGEPLGTFKFEAYDPETIAPDSLAEKALKAVCKKP